MPSQPLFLGGVREVWFSGVADKCPELMYLVKRRQIKQPEEMSGTWAMFQRWQREFP